MKQFLNIFRMPEGQGNIGYDFPPANAPNVLDAANDGLSTDLATGKIAQLGQAVGRPGDPAALTEDREIPDAGFSLFFGKNDGVSDVIGFNTSGGTSTSNASGLWIQLFAFAKNFQFFAASATSFVMDFFSSAFQLVFDSVTNRMTFSKTIIAQGGLGAGARSLASAVINVLGTDFFIGIDSSGGNVTVNMNPATLANQVINYKKTSADVNTITLTPTAGTIQGLGAAAATFVFNGQGENIQVYCNGTNFFIL